MGRLLQQHSVTTIQTGASAANSQEKRTLMRFSRPALEILSRWKGRKFFPPGLVSICIVMAAEAITAIWPGILGKDGRSWSFWTFLSACSRQTLWSSVSILVTVIAVIPLVTAIAREHLLQRVVRASSSVCLVFALQALVLTITPPQLLLAEGPPTVVVLGFLTGASSTQPHFGWAWLDFALPTPPFLLAVILMLVASGFTPTRLRLKTVFSGVIGWLLIELLVRPLLLTPH